MEIDKKKENKLKKEIMMIFLSPFFFLWCVLAFLFCCNAPPQKLSEIILCGILISHLKQIKEKQKLKKDNLCSIA